MRVNNIYWRCVRSPAVGERHICNRIAEIYLDIAYHAVALKRGPSMLNVDLNHTFLMDFFLLEAEPLAE